MRMRLSATACMSFATVAGKRGLPHQDQMTTDVQGGMFFRQANGVVESGADLAISVVEVRMPWRCASTIPWFTSRVNPKSSALTTSERTRFRKC